MTLDAAEHEAHLLEVAALAGVQYEELVLPTARILSVNGLRMRLLDWGQQHRPTILFVHGMGLTANTWDLVCLALRREYRCLALDLRGHGESAWSEASDYSLDAHRQDLTAVVDQIGVERFILVGMSLGGAVSLSYAAKHASRLDALVLVDTGPSGRSAGRERIAQFLSMEPELGSVDDFVERALAFNPLRRPDLLRRSLLHNLRQTPAGSWTWKWDPRLRRGMTEEHRAQRQATLWAAVPKVSCPTLVVRGGKSQNFHDEDAATLADALPDGRWVRIEGAGHTVQGDQPKLLVEELERFFATVGVAPER